MSAIRIIIYLRIRMRAYYIILLEAACPFLRSSCQVEVPLSTHIHLEVIGQCLASSALLLSYNSFIFWIRKVSTVALKETIIARHLYIH